MSEYHIIVAGDVPIFWLTFQCPLGGNLAQQSQHVKIVVRCGGAVLLTEFLRHAIPHHRDRICGPTIDEEIAHIEQEIPYMDQNIHSSEEPEKEPEEGPLYSIVDLVPVTYGTQSDASFRVERLRYLYKQPNGRPRQLGSKNGTCDILVLEDSGSGFRNIEDGVRLVETARPQRLIYKMARPLGIGRLWDRVRGGPFINDNTQDPNRLVVVVNADDLRAEGIELSRHLSWEKTCEDFVRQLASIGRLESLVTCANLIVCFDCDGVIYHKGREVADPMLYFDPEHAEGEFVQSCPGRMIGLTTAFTAGFTAGLAKILASDHPESAIDAGIKFGLTAARRLACEGFQTRGGNDAPDFPLYKVTRDITPDRKLSAVRIPPPKTVPDPSSWTILKDTFGAVDEIARLIVKIGPRIALSGVPIARFGRFLTADRKEIEGFRAITNLLHEYWAVPQTKPLSIGVFGRPGSGKSFGVTEVAKSVAKSMAQGRQVQQLEFNLSQFTDLADLTAAFQLIRDQSLSGFTPLVLFDEFDTFFVKELGWLRYFLAPMQDGKFLERGQTHPVGHAVFVFVGGTFSTFAEFSKASKERESRNAKGPDFVSRLRGYIDILGPDAVNEEEDRMYPIRRAILLHALLEKREPLLKAAGGLMIDDAVLNGLLTVPKYHHGARSLEMLLAMSTVSGRTHFECAALPSEAQLELHVDSKAFLDRVRHPHRLPDRMREEIAQELHEVYRQQRRDMAQTDAECQSLKSDEAMNEWDSLREDFKESSRLQADDIPQKLRMVNCYMANEVNARPAIPDFTDKEIEVWAKREHERYSAERLTKRWRLGDRNPEQKETPFLIPWRDLTPMWQDVDRALVRSIPKILLNVGYHIYRLEIGGA